ncbi:sugar phosphate isomerase/epimerase family protein [Fibrella arboris]|uniref:sugar phosphate isomerase/epimerase family protein n=1 Tax=Fibrella arboris TaxID=3242486 RepID=UPI003520F1EE
MMELGIFAKTFTGPLPTVLESVREAGLQRVQFNFACAGLPSMPEVVDEPTQTMIQAAFSQYPLAIEAVSGTFNMIHPDPAERLTGLRRLGVITEQCRWLGTSLVTLCTGTRNPNDMWKAHPANNLPDAWNDLRQTLDRALELAEQHELILGIEPETGNVVNTVEKAALLLRQVNSPRLRISFDPANLFEHEPLPIVTERLTHGLDLLGEFIVTAHAKDRDAQGQIVAAGRGVLPYATYLRGLKEIDYPGNLILHGLNPQEVGSSVQFLRQQLAAI